MNTAQIIESTPAVWTTDGELTAVPAANDNDLRWTSNPAVAFAAITGMPVDEAFRAYCDEPVAAAGMGMSGYLRKSDLPLPALPPIIALSGPAGCGKSTVSEYLASRHGYAKTKFAKPLKDMCRAIGMTESQIEGDDKETPVEWLGDNSPRHAMQTLGTEWGRRWMGDDFWVNLWARSAAGRPLVVVDDCRFPNEAAAVRRLGGRVIRVDGRGGIAGKHASEAGIGIADEVICNDGSVADLHDRVREVLEGWV